MTDDNDKPAQKRPVLSVVDGMADEDCFRGVRVGNEVGDYGVFQELDWEEQPTGYGVWARLMQRYLMEHAGRLNLEWLDVVMWRWKKVYRRLSARFLEMRASAELRGGREELAKMLCFYAACIAQGRDLDEKGEFAFNYGEVLGKCRNCECAIEVDDWTGTFLKAEPGDRYYHGNAIYRCRSCSYEYPSRLILAPNRHRKWKGASP